MPFISAGSVITDEAQILDGTIVNADINASAAIEGSKLQALSVGTNAGVIPSTGVANSHVAAAAAIADSKLAQITTASKVSGAALTSLASVPAGAGVLPSANTPAPTFAAGVATRATDAASGTQSIAHGLGRTPSLVIVHVTSVRIDSSTNVDCRSYGVFDGTNTASVSGVTRDTSGAVSSFSSTSNILSLQDTALTAKQEATCSVDGTNIDLAWTKTGTPNSGDTIKIAWVAT